MSVRFASRFVKHSVAELLETFLREYGWTTQTPPFGAVTASFRASAPTPSELKVVEGNTVFLSFGAEDDHRPMELGGGMLRQEYVLFVDVVGQDETITECLASDIKDRLTGLIGGTRYLRPANPTTGVALPGYLGEFADIMRHQPDGARKNWLTVSGALRVDFPGEES